MKSNSDIDLLEKIKQDDLEAYKVVFDGLYSELFRFAFSYIRDQLASEEIVQEVFLYLWDKRKKIEVHTTLKTYLYAAVKNKCLNYIRLELPKLQATTDVSEMIISNTNEEIDEGENFRLKKYIRQAIDQLPTKCRQIFMLSRNAGLTYEEIAEELDLSKKTVENQMGIALKKLRESLDLVYKYYIENRTEK